MALQATPGKAFHHVQSLGGVFPGKGLQLRQSLPEFGQTHRHDGNAVHLGVQCLQLPHGPQQSLPVVEAGAADDLAVHDNAGLGKAAHDRHALPRPGVSQQLAAQLRVGSVDGDVDGADVQGNDTLNLPLGEIGQGDVIAQQEAEPGVIILKVHGGAHALGQLVNKAEDAAVGAGPGRIHQIALEVQPQVAALVFQHMDVVLLPIRAAQQHIQLAVIGEELIVQHVQYSVVIDGQHRVPRLGLAMEGTGGVNGLYGVFHSIPPVRV